MIIALNEQLLHLAYGIFSAVWHMLGNIGDLRPNNHTVFIAKIIEILIVLIMSEANCVSAHLADDIHIRIVVLFCDGVTNSLPVLMAANTAKRIRFSVKEKSVLCINSEGTAAKLTTHTINSSIVYI